MDYDWMPFKYDPLTVESNYVFEVNLNDSKLLKNYLNQFNEY